MSDRSSSESDAQPDAQPEALPDAQPEALPDAQPKVRAADAAQLERWAFGRDSRVPDRELAEAALLELARRAGSPERPATEPETVPTPAPTPTAAPGANAAPPHPQNPAPDGLPVRGGPTNSAAPSTRRRRAAFTWALLTTALVAALISALVTTTVLTSIGRSPDPLAYVSGPLTPAEQALGTMMRTQGVDTTAGPRILGESAQGRVVGYLAGLRLIAGEPAEADHVCVGLLEGAVGPPTVGTGSTPLAPLYTVSDVRCTPIDEFRTTGLDGGLRGDSGLYVVRWSASGDITIQLPGSLQVGPSGQGGPRGDYRDALIGPLTEEARVAGRLLGRAGITLADGPAVITPVALIDDAPANDAGLIVAWSAIDPDPQRGVVVCLGVVDPTLSIAEAVRDAQCVLDEEMATAGIRFEAVFGEITTVWRWTDREGIRGSVTRG